MIPDLRRKLISVLHGDPDCTDAQLLALARGLVVERDTYRDACARNWGPMSRPWSAIKVGNLVLARGEEPSVWVLVGREVGEDGIAVRLIGPDGGTRQWTMRPDDTATVLAPLPEKFLDEAKGLLVEELGAS